MTMKSVIYSILCTFLINSYVFSMENDENKIIFNTIRNVASFYKAEKCDADADWDSIDFNAVENKVLLKSLNSNHYGDICKVFSLKEVFEEFCKFSNQETSKTEIECQETVKFLFSHISKEKILAQNNTDEDEMDLVDRMSLLEKIHKASYEMYGHLNTAYQELFKDDKKLKEEVHQKLLEAKKQLDENLQNLRNEEDALVLEKSRLRITNMQLKVCIDSISYLLLLTTAGFVSYIIILYKART